MNLLSAVAGGASRVMREGSHAHPVLAQRSVHSRLLLQFLNSDQSLFLLRRISATYLSLKTHGQALGLDWNKSARIVEFVPAAFAAIPHEQPGFVRNDLALGVQFNVGAIHWPRRRPLKIDSLRR